MKKITLSLAIFFGILSLVFFMKNKNLQEENDELKNGEERLVAIIDNAYSEKDYKNAKLNIAKLKEKHPESKKNVEYSKLLDEINEKEEEDAYEKIQDSYKKELYSETKSSISDFKKTYPMSKKNSELDSLLSLIESKEKEGELKKKKEIEEKERLANLNNTGKWYVLKGYFIQFNETISGTFNNSATENSKLNVKFKIESGRVVSIQLFEYGGNNPVKATSQFPEEYYISFWYGGDENGRNQELGSGWGENTWKEIKVNKEGSNAIIKALLAGRKVEFSIRGRGYNENSEYFFTLKENDVKYFENALRIFEEK